MNRRVTVAVVGLGFGADFVPLYLSHPDVERVVPVDPDDVRREWLARTYGLDPGTGELREVLADPEVDAVHLLTPITTGRTITYVWFGWASRRGEPSCSPLGHAPPLACYTVVACGRYPIVRSASSPASTVIGPKCATPPVDWLSIS